eukprot:11332715-Alexandrium_andersonii.AAC.1
MIQPSSSTPSGSRWCILPPLCPRTAPAQALQRPLSPWCPATPALERPATPLIWAGRARATQTLPLALVRPQAAPMAQPALERPWP